MVEEGMMRHRYQGGEEISENSSKTLDNPRSL